MSNVFFCLQFLPTNYPTFHSGSEAIKAGRRGKQWLRRSQKPVPVFAALLSRSIIHPSRTVVVDPCCGTGSSAIAAIGLGCAGWFGNDIDVGIVEPIKKRVEAFMTERQSENDEDTATFYNKMKRLVDWKVMSRASPVFEIPDSAPSHGIHVFVFLFPS